MRTETASSFFSWRDLNKRCGTCRSHSVKGLCEFEDIVVEDVRVMFVATGLNFKNPGMPALGQVDHAAQS